MNNWEEAARRYSQTAKSTSTVHDLAKSVREVAELKRRRRKEAKLQSWQARVSHIEAKLTAFMQEHGPIAITLLAKSGRTITFAEEHEVNHYAITYILDGNGLQSVMEAAGTWTIYSKNLPKPTFKQLSINEAAQAIASHGKAKAENIDQFLTDHLNAIAEQAP